MGKETIRYSLVRTGVWDRGAEGIINIAVARFGWDGVQAVNEKQVDGQR